MQWAMKSILKVSPVRSRMLIAGLATALIASPALAHPEDVIEGARRDLVVYALDPYYDRIQDWVFATEQDGRDDNMEGPRYYQVVRSQSYEGARPVRWADSRTCPGVQAAFDTLAQIQPPRMNLPGNIQNPGFPDTLVRDGTTYGVIGSGSTPDRRAMDMEWRAVDGPLATWAVQMQTALESCWQDHRPEDADVPID